MLKLYRSEPTASLEDMDEGLKGVIVSMLLTIKQQTIFLIRQH